MTTKAWISRARPIAKPTIATNSTIAPSVDFGRGMEGKRWGRLRRRRRASRPLRSPPRAPQLRLPPTRLNPPATSSATPPASATSSASAALRGRSLHLDQVRLAVVALARGRSRRGRNRLRRLRLGRPGGVDRALVVGHEDLVGDAPAPLGDARRLAHAIAQVVELRPPDVAVRGDLEPFDLRRVQRERPLDADPEGLLADGERLAHAASLPLDHDPLEDLGAGAGALDHLEVDANAVAGGEARAPLQLLLLEALDDRAHGWVIGRPPPGADGRQRSRKDRIRPRGPANGS